MDLKYNAKGLKVSFKMKHQPVANICMGKGFLNLPGQRKVAVLHINYK